MTTRKHKRLPIIGCAFSPDFRSAIENVEAYIDELRYYKPRGFSKLVKEGEAFIRGAELGIGADYYSEWKDDCDSLLTEWAQRVARNQYLIFGPFPDGGAIGFYVNTDGALEDCDLKVDDLSGIPRGFSGMVCEVNDHGNVTAMIFSRGRKCRELFSVV